jgi:superfamily I DNA/RNA helicase
MDLSSLNAEQRRAVETTEGRVLILAGAGSGKTRVLTTRMAYLINVLKVPPSQILGLTFTNKAAQEMRKRMGELVRKEQASQVSLSTFHSFCLSVLREDITHIGFTKNFSLYDSGDVERIIKVIVRDILEREADLPSLMPTLEAIARAKSKGLKADDLPTLTWHDQFTKTVYSRLKDALRAYNALDFDSLLTETVDLFERFPEVLAKYHDRIRYVMIDEYQDTNPVQFKLTALLSQKWGNLCVVGDDDQSIYGWRGASVRNILDFDQAAVVKLEQNFRSTTTILEAANHVIKHNQERHQKKLWSQKGSGSKIEIFHAPTDVNEAEAVAMRLAHIKEKTGAPWSKFAILYRSNRLSRQFEMALIKQMWKKGEGWVKGIPYHIFGGQEFYERKEVKDLLAYYKVCLNPLDQEALLRVVNYPRRGIGEGSLDALTSFNRQNKIPLWSVLKEPQVEISSKAKAGVEDFVKVIEELTLRMESNVGESYKWLLDRIDFKKAIHEEVKSDQMRGFKWENVEELGSALSEHTGDLKNFISDTLLNHHQFHQSHTSEDDRLSLMTFHSSKGLEFPYCFLVGLEDHIIPHERSLKEGSVEEERRLMYVAITRAQEKLVMSMARERKKMGQTEISNPSRFLLDIPKELFSPVKWDFLQSEDVISNPG